VSSSIDDQVEQIIRVEAMLCGRLRGRSGILRMADPSAKLIAPRPWVRRAQLEVADGEVGDPVIILGSRLEQPHHQRLPAAVREEVVDRVGRRTVAPEPAKTPRELAEVEA
jgi:hypothetical protein